MPLLKVDTVRKVARRILEGKLSEHELDEFCDEWDDVSILNDLDDSQTFPIIYRLIGRIDEAWSYKEDHSYNYGISVGLVFYHMGLDNNEQNEALYRLLMACMGHGIGLEDSFQKELRRAREILKMPLLATPVHYEADEWDELISPYLEGKYE